MPLTEEQAAALGLLAQAEPEEVAKEIKAKANGLWTQIFNAGHKKGTASTGRDLEEAEKARDDAQAEILRLTAELDKAQKGNPDVETVRQQAKAELDRQKAEWEQRERELTGRVDHLRRERVLDQFALLAEDPEVGNIRSGWGKILRRDPDLLARLDLSKEDPEGFEILQPGKKIPIQAEDDTPRGKLLALVREQAERLKREDPDAIRVRTDDGSGQRGGPQDTPASGDYDPVKDGQARGKAEAGAAADDNSLAWK